MSRQNLEAVNLTQHFVASKSLKSMKISHVLKHMELIFQREKKKLLKQAFMKYSLVFNHDFQLTYTFNCFKQFNQSSANNFKG